MKRVDIPGFDGLFILEAGLHCDLRGQFWEGWNEQTFLELGIYHGWKQDNFSLSHPGTVRGLHYQETLPQAKLVRCLKGEIFDVVVDIRKDSDSYGKHFSIRLSEHNKAALYVPEGFAHGFMAIGDGDQALVSYKCSSLRYPDGERGLRWDSPQLKIDWPKVAFPLTISDRDKNWPNWVE